MDIKKIVEDQREYFTSGQTLEVSFRLEQLKKLKTSIKLYEKELFDIIFNVCSAIIGFIYTSSIVSVKKLFKIIFKS